MLNKKSHIHFIGIGGIGMSGIAKILKHQGHTISGCDLDENQRTIKELQALGCKIAFEHNSALCQDKTIDIVVHTTAVQKTNRELITAKNRRVIIAHRSLMLAELMRMKYSIAVTGAHGKTTTSSIISHILIETQIDPTIIIGGHLKNISDNARYGKSEILVAEADESDKSIENLFPTWAVITNIDLEHLETYKDLDDIKETYKKFLGKLSFFGKAIICLDDPEIRSILPLNAKTITYGIEQKTNIRAKNIKLSTDHSIFDLYKDDIFIQKITVNMPGKHNILNSLAAIAVALDLEIPIDRIAKALKNFEGIERRFSFNGLYKGAEIFDDYGHHPNEIKHTITVAKKRAKRKLKVVFQPHRYTRTEKLWDQFIETFSNSEIDELIITDIFPASEIPIVNITSQNLVQSILQKNPRCAVSYIPLDNDFEQILKKVKENIQENDLLLLLGAGKINKISEKLIT